MIHLFSGSQIPVSLKQSFYFKSRQGVLTSGYLLLSNILYNRQAILFLWLWVTAKKERKKNQNNERLLLCFLDGLTWEDCWHAFHQIAWHLSCSDMLSIMVHFSIRIRLNYWTCQYWECLSLGEQTQIIIRQQARG